MTTSCSRHGFSSARCWSSFSWCLSSSTRFASIASAGSHRPTRFRQGNSAIKSPSGRYAVGMGNPVLLTPRQLRIVLPGGSGQVGRMLARFFQERGHHVTVLTRGPYTAPWQTVYWDGIEPGPWVETLEGADVCIHLSGRSINCRYTARNRRELYDSRIGPTLLLHRAFASLANPPRLWMNASSATIYRHAPQGTEFDRPMDEATGELGGNE